MDRRNRAAVDDLRKSHTLGVVQLRPPTGSFAIHQSFEAAGVEAQNPIPNDLQCDRTDPCRIGTRATVINGGKRQQATSLVCVFRLARDVTEKASTKIIAQ